MEIFIGIMFGTLVAIILYIFIVLLEDIRNGLDRIVEILVGE